MSGHSHKTESAPENRRRLARLAVSWYAIDAGQVDDVLRRVEEQHRVGQSPDFLEALRDEGLINEEQAYSLRHDHAPTQAIGTPPPPPDGDIPSWLLPRPKKGPGRTSPPAGDPTQIGQYRILRRLGQGGMGSVYLAFDTKENRQVAIKVLGSEHAPNQKVLQRFHNEGQHGAVLIHPNIVRSFDRGQDTTTGLHFIVFEFIDGPSAHELLDRTGKLQVGDAVHIILDIARAVEHAHKNQIIHRDIKPGNILLMSSGLAKLSDLGLAKRRDDTGNLTNASQGIGTPYYMPYEQAMNAKMADERSDIYALGATLYHLLTGDVPFPGESSLEIVEKKGIGQFPPASVLNPEVPERLDAILAKMLARDPENRYQTVSEVIVDLERSQLAAPIPSFTSLDSALQDPVVIERLTSPVERTQPDMNMQRALEERESREHALWFLRYRDRRGNLCKTKAATKEIVQRLSKGSIPPDAEAARKSQGPFKALEEWPEFSRAIAAVKSARKKPEPPPAAAPVALPASVPLRRDWWWWPAVIAVALGMVTLVGMTVYVVLRMT